MDRGVKIRDLSEELSEKIDNLDLKNYQNKKVSEFGQDMKVKSEVRSRSVILKKKEKENVHSMMPLNNRKDKVLFGNLENEKNYLKIGNDFLKNENGWEFENEFKKENDFKNENDLGFKKSFLKFDNIKSRNSINKNDGFFNGKNKVSKYSKVDFSKLNELNFETERENHNKIKNNLFYQNQSNSSLSVEIKENLKDKKDDKEFGSYKKLDEINFGAKNKDNKLEDVDFLNF